jgi:hypothetical protein
MTNSLLQYKVQVLLSKIPTNIVLGLQIFSIVIFQTTVTSYLHQEPVAYPGFFFGGIKQIQLRTEGRQNGDLGAVAP